MISLSAKKKRRQVTEWGEITFTGQQKFLAHEGWGPRCQTLSKVKTNCWFDQTISLSSFKINWYHQNLHTKKKLYQPPILCQYAIQNNAIFVFWIYEKCSKSPFSVITLHKNVHKEVVFHRIHLRLQNDLFICLQNTKKQKCAKLETWRKIQIKKFFSSISENFSKFQFCKNPPNCHFRS